MTNAEAARDRLLTLLSGRAVRFGEFLLASGRTSDLYVDIKSVFLDPEVLSLLGQLLVDRWRRPHLPIAAVGGMTLGADPLVSAFVLQTRAEGCDVPGFLVRKEAKGHGTKKYLEGADDLPEGGTVLLLEDVVTSGGSSLRTAARCREFGLDPICVLTVVDRGEGGREAIEAAGLEFRALFTRADLEAAR